MRVFKFLPICLSALTIASPAPQPTGGLLAEIPSILDNVKELVSKETIDDLQTIVKGGATLLGGDTPKNLQGLLSSGNIDKLQDIVDNAHTLLSPNFVNETSGLIGDAAPVCVPTPLPHAPVLAYILTVCSWCPMRLSYWEVCWGLCLTARVYT